MAINHPDPEGEVWFIAIKPEALYYNCYSRTPLSRIPLGNKFLSFIERCP